MLAHNAALGSLGASVGIDPIAGNEARPGGLSLAVKTGLPRRGVDPKRRRRCLGAGGWCHAVVGARSRNYGPCAAIVGPSAENLQALLLLPQGSDMHGRRAFQNERARRIGGERNQARPGPDVARFRSSGRRDRICPAVRRTRAPRSRVAHRPRRSRRTRGNVTGGAREALYRPQKFEAVVSPSVDAMIAPRRE
jgi:hypothetical protein